MMQIKTAKLCSIKIHNDKKYRLLQCISLIIIPLLIAPTITSQIPSKTDNHIQHSASGLDSVLLHILMKNLRKVMRSPSLSVGAIKNDEIVWYGGYGYAKVYKQEKPDIHTIYPIGSISKTITTTALLQLYEQGYIRLDDDVNEYLSFNLRNPYYPDHPITIRMLLSHRASLFDFEFFTRRGVITTTLQSGIPSDIGLWIKESLTPQGKWYHNKYWHRDYPPGAHACYSNTGFLIIGYIVEQVSGMSIEDYCQKNIFKPLEMYNTSFRPSNLHQDNFATPYIRSGGVFIPLPNYDTKGFASIGGVRSSIDDLSHFLIAHMNNGRYKDTQILNERTIQLMHNCVYKGCKIISPLNRWYGLGWWCTNRFGTTIQGHGGMIPGGSTFMMFNETNSIGYIIMTNQFDIFGFFHSIELFFEAQARMIIGELLLTKAQQF